MPGEPGCHQVAETVDRLRAAVSRLEEHGETNRNFDRQLDRDRLFVSLPIAKRPDRIVHPLLLWSVATRRSTRSRANCHNASVLPTG